MESYVGAMRSYCRVLDEKILLIKRNKILVLCAIALSLDPLFCYILVVHDDKKFLGLDRTLRTIAIVSRSVIDFLYILHIIFQFCATRSVNPVDILAILPLPQVGAKTIISSFWLSRKYANTVFIYFLGPLRSDELFSSAKQAYLLSEVAKSEERRVRVEQMRLKRQEMESWRPFLSFPENLREQILQNIECKLQENIPVDVHNFLPHLSMDLRKDTIRHLGMDLFKKCPAFDKWDRRLLDAMCDSLKPVIYTEESYIFQERGTVDAMHFIAQGRLMRLTTYGATTEAFLYRYLGYGDNCGEELITWAFDPHSSPIELPSSIATVQSLSKVLALVLKADDLKLIASQFRHLHDIHHARHTFRVYSNQWRTWAACYIQRVWRHYCKMKLEKSLEQQNGRLKEALAKDGTSSSSLGDNI
ncbi:hypothetical protein ACLB2K_003747 [Fragaria x ananassa]